MHRPKRSNFGCRGLRHPTAASDTPQELVAIGDRVGVDGTALAKASRLVAKVDSAAVQDGFDLYSTASLSLTTATGLSFSRA
jgi:hypothetical protein